MIDTSMILLCILFWLRTYSSMCLCLCPNIYVYMQIYIKIHETLPIVCFKYDLCLWFAPDVRVPVRVLCPERGGRLCLLRMISVPQYTVQQQLLSSAPGTPERATTAPTPPPRLRRTERRPAAVPPPATRGWSRNSAKCIWPVITIATRLTYSSSSSSSNNSCWRSLLSSWPTSTT